MPAQKRAKASFKFTNIPPWVYKLRHYRGVLFRHFAYFSSFDRVAFWKGIGAGLFKAPLNTGSIFVTGLFVDSIVDYYQGTGTLLLGGAVVPLPVLYLVALFAMSRCVRVLDMVYQTALIRLRNESLVHYRQDVAEKFHKLNSQEIDREQVKDIITKIESFWLSNATGFYERLTGVGEFFLSIIIAFVALFTSSPVIAVLVLFVPILEIAVVYKNFRAHAHYVDDIAPLMLERNYYFSALTEARSFPERKINGMFRSLINRFRHVADLVSEGYKRVLSKAEKETAEINVVDNLMLLGLKVYVLLSSIVDKIAIGKITASIGYVDSLYKNSYDLQKNVITMFDELTFIEYLYEFQDIAGFADERKKGKHLKKGIPRITLDHASFSYPDSGKGILRDVSLVIEPGDRVMILGKDGTGKSSLLALLAGLYELNEGRILFNRVPVPKLARGQIKAKMSVVPEDFARYYMTLKENIVLGDQRKEFHEVLYKKALEITGLGQWAKENNIDDEKTVLGNFFDNSVAISSGHWQRIAIARAIYRNRQVFLLDQPFTYIDSKSVEEMLPKLLKFIGKRTIIWIGEHTTHIKYMTKVYELEEMKLNETRESTGKKRRAKKPGS
jgi:ABC-type multidrug transport system fused ATPase/permease subunit